MDGAGAVLPGVLLVALLALLLHVLLLLLSALLRGPLELDGAGAEQDCLRPAGRVLLGRLPGRRPNNLPGHLNHNIGERDVVGSCGAAAASGVAASW